MTAALILEAGNIHDTAKRKPTENISRFEVAKKCLELIQSPFNRYL